ncbi:hypothetical protein GCM10025783_27260 [Amnibacterium soli]|jgi:hypothetical protein|uniref:Uncharacterized protein n=1 Tax=Amnibacterium soli TaxID=1282736 RepID=A0ABP8ZCC9_9MICO
MTITATQVPALQTSSSRSDPAAGGDVSWRALSADLWAARREGRHLGTVQRGRRWLAAGADSEPIGVFRTFAEAQAAVASPGARPAEARGSVLDASALVLVSMLAAGAAAGAWVWSTLLL